MADQRKCENDSVPALRFEGFSDPWEQRKLGELYEKAGRKNSGEYGGESIISVANMRFSPADRELAEGYLETYNVMDLGDIAFEGNRSKHFAHGRFVENDIGPGIVSHVFDVFRPKTQYDLAYWKYAINNERVMGAILVRSTKASTMMHNLVAADFLKESMPVPTVPEQSLIGSLFAKLDSLITLHQRKVDKLKTVKQSLLEKMFPREGENVPEIRFEGFTDPWEQRKVGDFLVESRELGAAGDLARKLTVKLWGKGVTEKSGTSGSEHTQYFVRHSGQFIYSKLDFLNAAFGVIPDHLDEYESTADLPAFDVRNLNANFLLLRVTQKSFYLSYGMIADGSRKAKRIHANTFLDMPLLVPPAAEQDRISQLFQKLDSLIALHQRELEILKNLKQACLEKMFV